MLGDRVVAPLMPGVAAGQPAQAHPAAAKDTIAVHRLLCVSRTRGGETAVGAQEWAEQVAVGANQEDDEAAHWRRCCPHRAVRAARKRGLSQPSTPPRTRRTRSRPFTSAAWVRKNSRARRLMRFRSTARRTQRFGTARPKRACSHPLATEMSTKGPAALRQPSAKARLNSAGRVIRWRRAKPALRGAGAMPCSRRQADSRARPLARRAFRIRRPPLVAIRARKPCVRARLILLGWNVRFMSQTPQRIRNRNHGRVARERPAKITARPAPVNGKRCVQHVDNSRLEG